MAERPDRKLFLGARLRRLRRELDLTQARMADDLGISPSYLNLIERNQRPVTAQVLLRLADAYELDLRSFSAEAEAAGSASLTEVFADPLFRDLSLSRHEVAELVENAPGVGEAVLRLYQAYLDRRRLSDVDIVDGDERTAVGAVTTTDWVRDHIQAQRNHFPELDELGEAIAEQLDAASAEDAAMALRVRLQARHGVRTQVATPEIMQGALRRFDPHRKRLFLSELMDAPGRSFGTAYQVALLEGGEALDALVRRATPPDPAARALLRVSLANTLAAAILMPYAPFQALAEQAAYDVDRLCARFGVGWEQACHRLTTLSRAGARGVPFFMLRIDQAGNVSKRFAATPAFPFARFGGTCARWRLHSAFRTPGRILAQVVETPDAARYFTFGRTVRRAAALHDRDVDDLAIGMGCELKHAHRLAYAHGVDLADGAATPIGPACRVCERPDCLQRAAQPLGRSLSVDDFKKPAAPYPFTPG